MTGFGIRQHLSAAEIRSLVETHPRLREGVHMMRERHGLRQRSAERFMERLVTFVVDGFGETHLGELSGGLARIAELRDRITGVYDSVLTGKGLPPDTSVEQVERMFTDLEGEMKSLRSASDRVKESGPLIREDVLAGRGATTVEGAPVAPVRVRGGGDPLAGQAAAFARLSQVKRAALEDIAASVPDLLWRAIESTEEEAQTAKMGEIATFMRKNGRNKDDIANVLQAITELSQAHKAEARRARVEPGGAYDPDTAEGELRLNAVERFRRRGQRLSRRQATDPSFRPTDAELAIMAAHGSPEFYQALQSNQDLARIAHEAPDFVAQFWVDYRNSGSPRAFSTYVFGRRMRTHMVGLVGEYTAAFELGPDLALIKGPDFDVTHGGTDAVGVVKRNGEMWLTDNKALREANVSAVTSLVDNILQNMEADSKGFRDIASRPDTPAYIREAIARHAEAKGEIGQYLSSPEGRSAPRDIQQRRITEILSVYRIRRVITNAGGEVTGLTEALRDLGIEIINVNR